LLIAKTFTEILFLRFEVLKAKFSDQAGEAEAAAGPLEATIKSLKNNIESVKKENGELQRRWMSSQMELVGLQNESLVANERVDRMRSQVCGGLRRIC
jgi:hypothetical protein